MFIDDLIICLTNDPSTNAYLTGGIRYDHIDKNSLETGRTKNWITFNSSKTSSEDELGRKDAVCHFNLTIQFISPSDTIVKYMAEVLDNYLSKYDDGRIRDLTLTDGDEIDYDFEKQLWFKTNIYDILYTR